MHIYVEWEDEQTLKKLFSPHSYKTVFESYFYSLCGLAGRPMATSPKLYPSEKYT